MTMPQQQPEPQPPQVGPAPVPQAVNVGQVGTPMGPMVVLQLTGPCGTWVAFLDPEAAQQVGKQLLDQGRTARSGLIVASGALPPLNGKASLS